MLSAVRWPDEGRLIHRAASGRSDQSDIEALWFMAGVGAAGATGRRRFCSWSWMPPFADSSLESLDQADEPQELTYVDIDTFLGSF